MAIQLEALTGVLSYKLDDADLKRARSEMLDLGKTWESGSREMDQYNTALKAGAVGMAGIAAAGAAASAVILKGVNAASLYGTAMAEVGTLNQDIAADLPAFRQEVLDLSSAMGQDATEAANAMYQAVSAGVPPDNAVSFLETATKTAIGGVTDMETAVDGLTTVLNAWQLEASEVDRVSDVLFAGVKQGKTTIDELSGSLFQAAPIAASLGVSVEEVVAATATLTKAGAPTSVALTQVRAALVAVQKGTEGMQPGLEWIAQKYPEVAAKADELGIGLGEAALQTLGFHGTMTALRDASQDLGVSVVEMTGRVEGAQAVLGLTGDSAQMAADDLSAVTNSAGSTEEAFGIMSDTVGYKMDQFREAINRAWIVLGEQFMPTVADILSIATPLLGKLTDLIGAFGKLPEPVRTLVVVGTGMVTVLGAAGAAAAGAALAMGPLIVQTGTLSGVLTMAIGPARGLILALGPYAIAIGAVVAAATLLISAHRDLERSINEALASVSDANGGWEQYRQAAMRAREEAGLLSKISDRLAHGYHQQEASVEDATDAWLRYNLGVSETVMSTKAFEEGQKKLHRQLIDDQINAVEYRKAMYELADSVSQAEGEGRVLTEGQQEQAEAFRESADALLQRIGVDIEATGQAERYNALVESMAENVATEAVSQEQANAILARTATVYEEAAVAAERHQRMVAQTEGTLQSYSAEFESMFRAGSEWSSDQAQQAENVEKAWQSLSDGTAGILQDMWSERQSLDEKLEEARQKDIAAQQSAAERRAEAEQKHNDKIAGLTEKLHQSKSDAAWRSTAEQIQAEEQKWAEVQATTQSVGWQNVAEVKAQYAEQVAANKEALAQMIVDHVNSMVLMGETSEDTAKTIFATLRQAYPDVEVFSPVADDHAALMADLRDATDDSSATQMDSIAALVTDIEGIAGATDEAVGSMEQRAADAAEVMDGWATASEVLAEREEAHATRMATAYDVLAGEVADSSGDIIVRHGMVASESEARADRSEEAMDREGRAHSGAADDISVAGQRIRDESQTTADSIADDAVSVESATGRMSSGFGMAASEIAATSQTISEQAANAGLRLTESYSDLYPTLDGVTTSLDKTSKAVKDQAGEVKTAGREQDRGYGDATQAVEDHSAAVETSLGLVRDELRDTEDSIYDTVDAYDDLPSKVDTTVGIIGVEPTLEQLTALEEGLTKFAGTFNLTITGSYEGEGGAEWTPSIALVHALEHAQVLAEEGVHIQGFVDEDLSGALDDGWLQDGLRDINALLDIAAGASGRADDALQQLLDTLSVLTDPASGAKEGSLAWLLDEWARRGSKSAGTKFPFIVDLEELFADLNIPASSAQEFFEFFSSLDLDGQVRIWERLTDRLKQMEDDHHKAVMDHLKEREQHTREKFGEGSPAHTKIVNAIKGEEDAHREIISALEEQNDLLEFQEEDYKALERAAEERARAAEQARRELEREIKDRQRELQDQENRINDQIEDRLDKQLEAAEEAYEAEERRLDGLESLEDRIHQQRSDHYDDLIQQHRDYIQEQERGLDDMALAIERWQESLGLGGMKRDLEDINNALRQLPTGREGRRGREQTKPEDRMRVQLTQLQRQVLSDLAASGRLSDSQMRLAQIAIQQGELRLDALRDLLQLAQSEADTAITAAERELDVRKEALESAKLRWETEKRGVEDQIADLETLAGEEDDRHQERMDQIDQWRQRADATYQAEEDRIGRLRELNEDRHEQRMQELEEEFAFKLMIAEGLSVEEATAEIMRLRQMVTDAIRMADEELAKLEDRTKQTWQIPYEFVPVAPTGPTLPGVPRVRGLPTEPVILPVEFTVSGVGSGGFSGEELPDPTGGEDLPSMDELQSMWDRAQKFAGRRGFHAAGFKAWVRKWFPEAYELYFGEGFEGATDQGGGYGVFGGLVDSGTAAGGALQEHLIDPVNAGLTEMEMRASNVATQFEAIGGALVEPPEEPGVPEPGGLGEQPISFAEMFASAGVPTGAPPMVVVEGGGGSTYVGDRTYHQNAPINMFDLSDAPDEFVQLLQDFVGLRSGQP